jgi:uncharacterized protein (TIGR02596 family)
MKKIESHFQLRHARGFTLIELMVVMAVMTMMLTVSLSVSSAWKSQKLNAQARQLSSDFSQAALLAQKDNYPVQFRFYMLQDELGLGANAMRAFQMARLTGYDPQSQQPQYTTLSEVRYFEDDIMLMESPSYTSLASSTPSNPVPTDPKVRGIQRPYRSFMFLPNGTTTLPRTPDAVFTLVKEHDLRNGAGNLPDNYRSVTLQPVTGKATTY